MEYEVPRNLDTPDRVGIPFFTTVQFLIFCGGLLAAYGVSQTPFPDWLKPWLLLYIPLLTLILPRKMGSGWTVYQLLSARLGRYLRPRRMVWKPE